MRTSIRLLVLISLPLFACHPSLAADPAEHDRAVKALESARIRVVRDEGDPNKIVRVAFSCGGCTPEMLTHLAPLTELRELRLVLRERMSEKELEPLRQLKALEKLTLVLTEGGDELLAQVPHLPALKVLVIERVRVSDKGLEHLHGLKQLQTICISDCKGVTPEGLAALRAGLPEAKVNGVALKGQPAGRR